MSNNNKKSKAATHHGKFRVNETNRKVKPFLPLTLPGSN